MIMNLYNVFVASLESALGIGGLSSAETDMEKMIRTGEMTPFGTVVQSNDAHRRPATVPSTSPRPGTSAQVSDFEKFLLNQDKKGEHKRKMAGTTSIAQSIKSETDAKKSSSNDKTTLRRKSQPDERSKKSRKKMKSEESFKKFIEEQDSNIFDKKSKMIHRPAEKYISKDRQRKRKSFPKLSRNMSDDDEMSDVEMDGDDEEAGVAEDSSDEYIPDEEELRGSWKDDDKGESSKTKGRQMFLNPFINSFEWT